MRLIAACLFCAMLFCGCSTEHQLDQAIAFRQKMQNSEGCSFRCDITADYIDKLYTFKMDCNFDSLGNMKFQVIEPQSISGITGSVDHEGGKLIFDEQALAFDLLADGYVTPVSAPWLMVKTIRSGYIESCSHDKDTYHMTLNDSYEEGALQLEIWLDSDYFPMRCEMIWQGRRILSLDVNGFSYM